MDTKCFPTAREITSHKVNGLNEAIRIFVLDKPGHGNACHKYVVCVPSSFATECGREIVNQNEMADSQSNPEPDEESTFVYRFDGRDDNDGSRIVYVPGSNILKILERPTNGGIASVNYYETQDISFQNGPIKEEGINGNSQEALLAVLIDRLEGFQEGPFKCHDNQVALDAIQTARLWLHKRTMDRLARNVEGTTAK